MKYLQGWKWTNHSYVPQHKGIYKYDVEQKEAKHK